MSSFFKWATICVLVLIPAAVSATFEAESVIKTKLDAPILDVATNAEENLAFLLTKGAVLIYSIDEKAVLDRIPLDGPFDRISLLDDERLVVTDSTTAQLNVIQFNRIYDIDLSGRYFKGPADAKVTLVVFDDYQCPYCARLEKFVEQVLAQFPSEVKYVIKHYPLASHSFAQRGAMAALAAGRQGKFWEFHSRLLENHNQVSEQKILEVAGELGLDLEAFKKDRELPESRALIKADVENGKAVGVSGTPSVFLNGKRIANRNLSRLPELIIREMGP